MKKTVLDILSLFMILFCCSFGGDSINNEETQKLLVRVNGADLDNILDLADSARKAGDDQKALTLYMAVSSSNERYGDSAVPYQLRAYIGAGDILLLKCDYAGALDYYVRGLKLSESMAGSPYVAKFYNNIARVYWSVSDFETAVRYNKIALARCVDDEPVLRRKILDNLAGLYSYLGNPKESRRYLELSREVKAPHDGESRYLDILIEGMVLADEGRHDEAIVKFHEAERFARDNRLDPRFVCSCLQYIYMTYNEMGRPDSAFHYMKLCERETAENGISWRFPNLLMSMSNYYRQTGDMASSQRYRVRYLDLRDSLSNEHDFNSVRNMQMQYEAAIVAGKIENLQMENAKGVETIKKQKGVLAGILAGLAMLIIFFVVIYRQKMRLGESYKTLYDLNREYTAQIKGLRESRIEDGTLLKEKDNVIAELRQRLGEYDRENFTGKEQGSREVDTASPAPSKYNSSKLDRDTMTRIASAIYKAMEEDRIFCKPDFSLDQLSEVIGSNTTYVSQTINETYGKNFSSFVNEYRINLAKERLSDPAFARFTIKSIGEGIGFKSHSSFCTVFHKSTGLSPSVYQKLSREENS